MPDWLLVMQQQASKPRPLAGRTISVSASLDHPTRFSYDPTASYDGAASPSCILPACTLLQRLRLAPLAVLPFLLLFLFWFERPLTSLLHSYLPASTSGCVIHTAKTTSRHTACSVLCAALL